MGDGTTPPHNPIEYKMQEVADALNAYVAAKVASTAALTVMVQKHNAKAAYAEMSKAMTDYVNAFNAITAASNLMRAKFDETKVLLFTMVVGMENLTNEQVETMKQNPQQYFAAGYLALVNSLLFFPREFGLQIAELVHTDLVTDINNAWNDFDAGITPEVPRPSVVYESDNALDIVNKALQDANN